MKDKKTKVINYTWWIFALIGIIIGLVNSDSSYSDSSPLAFSLMGAINGALIGLLIGYIIDKIISSDTAKNVSKTIQEQKDNHKLNKNIRQSMNVYKDAKHRFQFLSDETLMEKFSNEKPEDVDNMERLALEEEMVRRGQIKYSPMHEKLDKINSLS